MNIFYTHPCPKQAARHLCMIHVNKMIIESAQMLSAAHHTLDDSCLPSLCKLAYPQHPCTVWVRSGALNYIWLLEHLKELGRIYKGYRGKHHATINNRLKALNILPLNIPDIPFFAPPLCMPDRFKSINVCTSYTLYIQDKYREWQTRENPLNVVFYKEVQND